MAKRIYTVCSFLILLTLSGGVDARIKYTINDRWLFAKADIEHASLDSAEGIEWEWVNIPHTYNDKDGDDEVPGYYRGPTWYKKWIEIDAAKRGKHATIYFEGSNQVTEVYVNGEFAGKHIGGYTRFCFDITPYLKYGEKNFFAIKVDNTHNPDIPPLSADFTFYGGIYRDVYLQFTDKVHLATNDYASTGVYITTPTVDKDFATLNIKSLVTNEGDKKSRIIIEQSIIDADGVEIKKAQENHTIEANSTKTIIQSKVLIDNPKLWDVEHPYLYKLYTRIYDRASKKLLDEVVNPIGIRTFEFDVDKGFFLNGRYLKLMGTNRHQDYFQKGNALRDEMHVRDVKLMKEMGSNFLRISHYPQDPIITEMCDKYGILNSIEIPVVNAVTENEAFIDNAVNMAIEMIRQNFNHPSTIIWAYMNEVLLRQPFTEEARLKEYYVEVEKTARALEDAIRAEDPTRYTMMAYHNAPDRYENSKLTDIPMIHGWNLYQGWYEPDIDEFQRLLDRARDTYKGKILMVTEYGADVDPRLHSFHPERFDFTQEYGMVYHEHYYKEMMKRPFIAGFTVWNLNDFYAEPRVDAVPHVNNKGITGLNRERKDTYLFYKTIMNENPIILIGNKEWKSRGGTANSGQDKCVQPVPVFSNLPEVELFLNGQSLGVKQCESNIARYRVPFVDGENLLEAKSVNGKCDVKDLLRVSFKLFPEQIQLSEQNFELNVMLGSHRYFEDREAEMVWIPEQAYKEGSWGYVGGEAYRRATNFGTLLGTDLDILGSENDPIFQTQRTGIEQFKADVPDGQYSVYLYFSEIEFTDDTEVSIYNLGADQIEKSQSSTARVFDISINGELLIQNFDIQKEYGTTTAVIKKFVVNVKDGTGLTISFGKRTGDPVLNAVRIYQNY